jgi:purine catabolism regulator
MSFYAPAFAAIEEGEMALLSVEGLRMLDERLSLAQALTTLADHGIVGVAVLGEVTEAAVAEADRGGIGLFQLPSDADLRDIEKDIIRLIVEREAQLDRRGRQIYRQLAQLSLEGAGLTAIAKALRDLVNKTVVVQDARLEILAAAHRDLCPYTPTELATLLTNGEQLYAWLGERALDAKSPPHTRLALPEEQCLRWVVGIVIENQLGGYLSIIGPRERFDELEQLAGERAALVCAIELAKQRAVEAAEQRLRGDFIDLLLTAGPSERGALRRRASEIGYELEGEHVVVLFAGDGDMEGAMDFLGREFRARMATDGVQVLLGPYEGDLAGLCRAQVDNLLYKVESAIRATRTYMARVFPQVEVAAGIGRPGPGLSGLRRSFVQARESLALIRSLFDGDRVLSFGELSLYHLLGHLRYSDELLTFFGQTLEPLIQYDATHDTELTRTLEAFFAHHGNVSQTAEYLFLHRNSLLYRLERIEEITDLDLDDADDRFALQLALKLRPFIQDADTLDDVTSS